MGAAAVLSNRWDTDAGGQVGVAGLDDLLKETVINGSLRFTSDIGDALETSEIVFLCVGTPSGADGHADMKYVLQAAGESHTAMPATRATTTIFRCVERSAE